MIQKYAGKDARKPKLNKLGGQEWTRTKNRVRGAVKQIAGDLVKLYAQREQQNGYAFGEDTVWQREFEELSLLMRLRIRFLQLKPQRLICRAIK